MRKLLRRLALTGATAMALAPAGAGAATIVVERTDDAANGSFDDVGCTLRDAIRAANTNSSAPLGCVGDSAGADTIVLQSGQTYRLTTHGVDDSNAAGDLDISGPVTIRSSGPGLARIDAASNTLPGPPTGADRAIHVLASAGDVTLEGIRVEGGFVQHSAPPTFNGGGGIRTESLLKLVRSEVVGNQAQGSGIVLGGGIWAHGPTARLRVQASTVAENTVVQLGEQATGGGIAAYPDVAELTIENSTVSGNRSQGLTGRAGGIFGGDYLNSPAATLTHVTVVANSGANMGGIWLRGTITGSLIAANTATLNDWDDCYSSGTIDSGGGNLIGEVGPGADCALKGQGDLVGAENAPIGPNLGTLVNNGGPTRTRVPNTGSPALDRGGPCPATDQRGFFRFSAGPCDAGAVEVGVSVDPPPSPQPPAVPAAPPAPAPPAAATTGKRAAALARCGKLKKATRKQTRKARNRCRANARKLPL